MRNTSFQRLGTIQTETYFSESLDTISVLNTFRLLLIQLSTVSHIHLRGVRNDFVSVYLD